MAGERDPDVDPRFDPVFQRGYDPSRHRTRARAPSRGEEPAAASAAVTSPHDAPIGQAAAQPEIVGPHEAQDVPPRRNPYRLALLLLSLAAIGGAGLLLWKRLAEDPYGGYGGVGGSVPQVFFQQLVDASLAPLLTGGLLGLCLWLALGALRRRDRG